MDEKRNHPRKKYHQFVDFSDGRQSRLNAMSDISASGMLIRTRRTRPPIGSEITLDFELMDQPIYVAAEVVRHDMRGFGAEFIPESAEEKSWIEKLVERLPWRGGTEYPQLELGIEEF